LGFHFRKSLRFGPLRRNFSKRGVGTSIGVKGARVGLDAGGREDVAGGRGGLYFRQRGPRVRGAMFFAIAILAR
jgi:hypothetical protein